MELLTGVEPTRLGMVVIWFGIFWISLSKVR